MRKLTDGLLTWVKDIFLIIISLSFFQILLPESSMEKYLKFIFSIIIMAVIIQPVICIMGHIGT
ncbi:MAG: stage III sporulation protein AF [Anaerovoracaceae bacterium]|nr:stage III sporulation protein AF [Bacillota bacterium]MDY5771464.1 stage III sporulation protein AF [Anaerovoracaceae bacterium]